MHKHVHVHIYTWSCWSRRVSWFSTLSLSFLVSKSPYPDILRSGRRGRLEDIRGRVKNNTNDSLWKHKRYDDLVLSHTWKGHNMRVKGRRTEDVVECVKKNIFVCESVTFFPEMWQMWRVALFVTEKSDKCDVMWKCTCMTTTTRQTHDRDNKSFDTGKLCIRRRSDGKR